MAGRVDKMMGETGLLHCSCGYEARVSGRAEAGFGADTHTIHCLDCAELYEVTVKVGCTETPAYGPRSARHRSERWRAPGACPRCGETMGEGGSAGAEGAMQLHLVDTVDGPVAPERAPILEDPVVLARHIKQAAYFLRADVVGTCRLPEYAIYTHRKDGEPVTTRHQNAIGILIDQDYGSFAGGTGHDWISNSQSFMSYSASGFIACILADYIRRLGYPARAHHARDYQVVVPPILLHAGLGEMCRIGDVVLNPFLGPRFKAAVVTTDLPLAPDKPIDFGLQHFCTVCRKCARECPSGAITDEGKTWYNGYEVWKPDADACTRYRVTNTLGAGCGHCIKVCPWNKDDTWYHSVATALARRSGLARRGLTWLDDALGHGRPDPRRKWWFDLEEVDGWLVQR